MSRSGLVLCFMAFGVVLLFSVLGLQVATFFTSMTTSSVVVANSGGASATVAANNLDLQAQQMRSNLEHHLNTLKESLEASTPKTPTTVVGLQIEENIEDNTIVLMQADFDQGTYRIRTPGRYRLGEDIVFNPRADDDWRPDRVQYPDAAYRLDFFAALTIETDHVLLDLGGYTLRQSEVHALQQRFLALIELADRPFITGQGPADFGQDTMRVAEHVVIRNGRLGLSSHHSIHGNGARYVLLEDLVFEQYEVAAVSLNGCSDVMVRRCDVLGQRLDVPVIGTYSNARFIMPFVDAALELAQAGQTQQDAAYGERVGADQATLVQALEESRSRLDELMQQVLDDVVTAGSGAIDSIEHPEAYRLFANPSGKTDGNTYGLLFNALGVAVNGFADRKDIGSESQRIVVEDCRVLQTTAHIIEVVAMVRGLQKSVQGPAGDRLRFIDNNGEIERSLVTDEGAYRPTALADTQLALIALVSGWPQDVQRRFGTLFRDEEGYLWRWRQGTMDMGQVVRGNDEGNEPELYRFLRNGDTMFHTNKGVVAVRIDASSDVLLSHVTIDSVSNSAPKGNNRPLAGELGAGHYTGAHDGGHPGQAPQAGYMGCDTRGISISSGQRVTLNSVKISDVVSQHGYAIGVDVLNLSEDVYLRDVVIDGVAVEVPDDDNETMVNSNGQLRQPKAIGLHTSSDSSRVFVVEETFNNIETSGNLVDSALDRASTAYSETKRMREAAEQLGIVRQKAYLL